jgi:hypothetical protein
MEVLRKLLSMTSAKDAVYKRLSTGVVTRTIGNTIEVITDGHRRY